MSKPKHSVIISECNISDGTQLAAQLVGMFEKIDADTDEVLSFIQGVANGFGIAAELLSADNTSTEKCADILADAKQAIFEALSASLSKEGGES
jgi:NDP-sugar pyrophosphorylase family protein